MALVAGVFGLAMLVLGLAMTAEAQVQKSGKAELLSIGHYEFTVQKFPDGSYHVAGATRGIYYNKAGDGFDHNMGSECSLYDQVSDLAKGTIPVRIWACIVRDRDGDAIFTKTSCSTTTWDDWCGGKIVAGSGKFAGISGTLRGKSEGSQYYRRTCLAAPKADDCKAYYASAGSIPVGVTYSLVGEGGDVEEWEWKIP
jgi:hypothetical protein